MGSGGVQLVWDAPAAAGPLAAGEPWEYWAWRERLDVHNSTFGGGRPAYRGVVDTAILDEGVVSGGTYRYGVSVLCATCAVTGRVVRSVASDPVTVTVPAPLGDNDPAVARFAVQGHGAVDTAGQHRHDVEAEGGQAKVSVQANALDAEVSAQVIRADDFAVHGQDLNDPVELSESGDTLLIVHTRSTDNTREQAHILRLRPPTDPDPDPVTTKGANTKDANTPNTVTSLWSSWQRTADTRSAPRNAPAEPRLAALAISPGTLDPAFAADAFEYTAQVAHNTAQVTITPTAAAGTTVLIAAPDADPDTDGHQIALNAPIADSSAQTAIVIAVANTANRLDSYTVTITRAAVPPNDATLSALTVGDLTLHPAFDPATTTYTAAADLDTVTVAAATTHSAASAAIEPADADTDAEGHQVDLARGDNTVTVTVTPLDGDANTYTVTVTQAPPGPFGRNRSEDLDVSPAADDPKPIGLWSDGATMWVADRDDDKIYAFDAVTGARQADKDLDTLAAAGNSGVNGLWSDGATMWLTDVGDSKVYAYDLATGARQADKDLDTLAAAGNSSPEGLWSNGTTMWIADQDDDKIYAYDLATGARQADKDLDTLAAAGNISPQGLWSDGTNMWVADHGDTKLYAYDLVSGVRKPDLDFDALAAAGNSRPEGSVVRQQNHVGSRPRRRQHLRLQHAPEALRAEPSTGHDAGYGQHVAGRPVVRRRHLVGGRPRRRQDLRLRPRQRRPDARQGHRIPGGQAQHPPRGSVFGRHHVMGGASADLVVAFVVSDICVRPQHRRPQIRV